jgi:hypothetical protein
MNPIRSTLAAVIAVVAVATQSVGGGAPISVSHKLTGQSGGGAAATAEYALHVVNLGTVELREVSLALVPQPPQVLETASAEVGTLAPGQSADLQLRVTTRGKLPAGVKAPKALWWKGKAVDPTGTVVLFPVKSRSEVSHE